MLQILKTRLPECSASSPERFNEWYNAVIWEMSQERITTRRNRINPRVIKRKMSSGTSAAQNAESKCR